MAENKSDFVDIHDEEMVRINYRIPSKMPSVYANNTFVQETPDEVVISFFETVHPIIPPDQPKSETLKQLREKGVIAECVARITVAKHRFPAVAAVFSEIGNRILEQAGALEEGEEKEG